MRIEARPIEVIETTATEEEWAAIIAAAAALATAIVKAVC